MQQNRTNKNTNIGIGLRRLLGGAAVLLLSVVVSSSVLARDLPGASQTSYAVSPSGAFQFQVPITVPVGRNNVQPNLSLSYGSGGGSGPLGVGWGVSGLGSITRCGRTYATDGIAGGVLHDANDRFCLNGKRLIKVSGSGDYSAANSEYRTEVDEISKVVGYQSAPNLDGGSSPLYFKVWRKNGTIMTYGSTSNSRFTLSNSSSVHAWRLRQVEDRYGNNYKVNYEQSYRLPSTITYAGGYTVSFYYATRHDVREQYILGRKYTYNKRLSSIVVERDSTILRSYDLTYLDEEQSATPKRYHKSKLSKIIECGTNLGGGRPCMPAIEIDWRTDNGGFKNQSPGANPPERLIHYDESQDNLQITRGQWVDVNGDGLVDQVIAVKHPSGSQELKTLINNGSGGFVEKSNWKLNRVLRDYHFPTINDHFLSKVVNHGQLIDVNGDGLIDVVYAYVRPNNVSLSNYAVAIKETWLNNGNGFIKSTVAPPDYIYSYVDSVSGYGYVNGEQYYNVKEVMRGRFVDINGDGYVDWLRAFTNVRQGYVERRDTWLNTGANHGWSNNSNYRMPTVFGGTLRIDWVIRYGELIDLNGDGLLDWLRSHKDAHDAAPTQAAWINTGSGWQRNDAFVFPGSGEYIYESNGGHNPPTTRGAFVDLNGDGLKDWVRSHNDYTYGFDGSNPANYLHGSDRAVRLNTGKGWTGIISNYKPDFVHFDHSRTGGSDPWPVRVAGYYLDVNQDGLVDFLQSYRRPRDNDTHMNTWLNTGAGWEKDNSYNVNWLFADYSGRNAAKIGQGNFVDIDADGSLDWVRNREGQSVSYRVNKLDRANQINAITTTMGVEIKPTMVSMVSQDGLYTENTGTTEGHSSHVAGTMYVTSKLEVTNALGGINVVEYSYEGAQSHRRGRGFLGFKKRTVHNVEQGIRQEIEYRQDYPFIGRVKEQRSYEAGTINRNHWISRTVNTYNSRSLNGGKTVLPYMRTREVFGAELQTNLGGQYVWAKTTYDYLNDNYGNVDKVTTEVGSSSSDKLKRTVIDYDYHPASSSNWQVGLVEYTTSTETLLGSSKPPRSNRSRLTYTSAGDVEYLYREPDSAQDEIKLTTRYSYDGFGNLTGVTETPADTSLPSRTESIGYDVDSRLPVSLTNALTQATLITYHPRCDQPDTVTEPARASAVLEYDGFCRQIKVTDPSGVYQTTNYTHDSAWQSASLNCSAEGCQVAPKLKIQSQSKGEFPVVVYYNHFGQPMVSTTQGMFANQTIRSRVEYDALGRTKLATQPFYVGDSVFDMQYEYDVLNRQTKTIYSHDGPNGRANATYDYEVDPATSQRVRKVTDVLGRTTEVFANALGQVSRIKDTNGQPMQYEYDASGNLAETTDALGNQVFVAYDKLGRRTGLVDPDMGLSIFTYDAFGDLRAQKDAKNQTISMQYDALGRLEYRTIPVANADPEVSRWIYDDPATNGVGRLSRVIQGTAIGAPVPEVNEPTDQVRYGYDQYGRLDAIITKIRGLSFTESFSYDDDGRLSSRRYPSSGKTSNNEDQVFAVKYGYTSGYLETVSGLDAVGEVCIEHWRADQYDALGRLQRDTLGTLIETNRSYDPAQGVLKRIHSIVTKGRTGTLGTVQDLEYEYQANNNLQRREDKLSGKIESFAYDNLDRLISHQTDGAATVNIVYNEIGNIISKSDVGTYNYNGSGGPHAVSRVDSLANSVDPLAKFQVDWEWNGEKVLQAQADILDEDYQYDANGNIRQQGNRYFYWTSFDKPHTMVRVDRSNGTQRGSVIEYNADFERKYKRETTFNQFGVENAGGGYVGDWKQETYYIGKDYERITEKDGSITHRYTIQTGGNSVQIERADGSDKDVPRYLLADNLGSTNAIINASGEVEQRLEFDPWGMRNNIGDPTAVNAITNKGYTGHETDDEVGVINMNARVYDPYLGVFMSADPVLPDAHNMQAYNRYAYVLGNPLKYTDPTGNEPDYNCVLYDECGSGGGGIGWILLPEHSGSPFPPSQYQDADVVIGEAMEDYHDGTISQEYLIGIVLASTDGTMDPIPNVEIGGDTNIDGGGGSQPGEASGSSSAESVDNRVQSSNDGKTDNKKPADVLSTPELDQYANDVLSSLPRKKPYEEAVIFYENKDGSLNHTPPEKLGPIGGPVDTSVLPGGVKIRGIGHTHPYFRRGDKKTCDCEPDITNKANRRKGPGDHLVVREQRLPNFFRVPSGKTVKVVELKNGRIRTRRVKPRKDKGGT